MPKKIFNLPDEAFQFWKPFSYQGQDFNLDHLKACKHTFTHPDRSEQYTIFFTFSHHTFTRSIKDSSHQSHDIYPLPSKDPRLFDIERYHLSKFLPEIVRTLPDQYTYHGGYSRYCSCKIKNDAGQAIYYQVVYRAWREHGKIRFHIESAYPLSDRPGKVKKVNFWSICFALVKNKKLPAPQN